MGYLHINNLYREQDILMFKECYALEKIHGTSAHIKFKQKPNVINEWDLTFFSGGESHEKFVSLFDQADLIAKITEKGIPAQEITIYGEAYGGKCQGMSETYGKELKFIVFDVKIGDCWLDVPKAESVAKSLGLEFVHYARVTTDLKVLDAERDAFSVQAIRNGCGPDKHREGVVLRPLIELTKNNGDRLICKHKGAAFSETAKPQKVVDPAKAEYWKQAEEIANQWVTLNRLKNVLSHLKEEEIKMENMGKIITLMQEDVQREAEGEIVWNEDVKKMVGRKTVPLFKAYLGARIVA